MSRAHHQRQLQELVRPLRVLVLVQRLLGALHLCQAVSCHQAFHRVAQSVAANRQGFDQAQTGIEPAL